jgi:hypothetical protein
MRTAETDEYVSAAVAARISGRTEHWVHSEADSGRIRTDREGRNGSRRFSRADVLRLTGIIR